MNGDDQPLGLDGFGGPTGFVDLGIGKCLAKQGSFSTLFLPSKKTTTSCFWIGLRENLQENPIFNGKIYGFRFRFSLKPIHWCFFFESPGFSYTDMIDMIYAQYMQVVGLRETVWRTAARTKILLPSIAGHCSQRPVVQESGTRCWKDFLQGRLSCCQVKSEAVFEVSSCHVITCHLGLGNRHVTMWPRAEMHGHFMHHGSALIRSGLLTSGSMGMVIGERTSFWSLWHMMRTTLKNRPHQNSDKTKDTLRIKSGVFSFNNHSTWQLPDFRLRGCNRRTLAKKILNSSKSIEPLWSMSISLKTYSALRRILMPEGPKVPVVYYIIFE